MSENLDAFSAEFLNEMANIGDEVVAEFESDATEKAEIEKLLSELSEAVTIQDSETSSASEISEAQSKFSEITEKLSEMGYSLIDYYGDFVRGVMFSQIAEKLIRQKRAKE